MTTSPTDHPLLSVIVPVFNDAVSLRRCLDALDRQTLPKDRFEVIVVDNGSHHPVSPVVADYGFARCVIEERQGSYVARNTGVRHATGAILVFTDADCQPLSGWLAQVAMVFELQPGVSAIGGRIDLEVSRERAPAELHELVLSPFPQQQLIERRGFAATANMAVRASTFRLVGPFNETLLSSGDQEWGNRLVSAGYQLHYAAQCVVVHPARKTVRSLVNRRRRIEGGAVGLASGRGATCPAPDIRRVHPERRKLAFDLLLHPEVHGLGRVEGLKVLALAGYLVAVRLLEGMRLRLGGRPLR